MTSLLPGITSLAGAIQLSVAPVFLLAGVGATLNVLASRIGRIIDRARTYEERLERSTGDAATQLTSRLQALSRRAALISWAIGLSVICALLVSLVVTGLFLSAALAIDLTLPIAIGFVVALLSLALALLLFLREVVIANAAMTFGGTKVAKEAKGKKP
jgi:hypothetical protein